MRLTCLLYRVTCAPGTQVSLSPVIRREQAEEEAAAAAAAAAAEGVAPVISTAAPAAAPADAATVSEEVARESSVVPPDQESAAAAGGSGTRTVPVPYVVGPHDTWGSICLRHRMTSEEMMKLNGLRNRRARVGDVLLVYAERSDEQQNEDWKRQLLRQFRRQTGCVAAEAVYYLEQHDYRIGDAIRARTYDHKWESERAKLVSTILADEEAAAIAAAKAEQLAAEEAAAHDALVAQALARQKQAAAHAEAIRSLSACLGQDVAASSRCLACLS